MTRPPKTWKSYLLTAAKLTFFAALCWFIYNTFVSGNETLAKHSWHADPFWLVVSGLLYASGLAPMAVFWRMVVTRAGQQVGRAEAQRAYFISQLGKYVPGKLMVIVMRRAMLYSTSAETTVVAASVFFETFFMLAIGAGMSAVILLIWYRDHPLLLGLAAGTTVLLGVPALPSVFQWLMKVMRVGKLNPQAIERFDHLGARTLLIGALVVALGWTLQGASLWATLRSMDAARGGPFDDLSLHTAAVSLGVSAGFVSQLPGGLGVREFISAELMEPVYGRDVALVSSIIYRLVLLVSELVVSTILYVIGWRRPHKSVAAVEDELESAE